MVGSIKQLSVELLWMEIGCSVSSELVENSTSGCSCCMPGKLCKQSTPERLDRTDDIYPS
jgi:hypothetical protein